MLTKELAVWLGENGGTLYHRSLKNSDGTALRVRVNGKCKTWKRDTGRWELPVKHGLRDCMRICSDATTNTAPDCWTTLEPLTPKERVTLTKAVGLAYNTPLGILRDALVDASNHYADFVHARVVDGQD